MKKVIIVLIVCIASMKQSIAQDFRGFTWGNSISSVEAGEKSKFIAKVNNDELTYKDLLGGSECDVIYIFNDNDKLASGLYVFTKKYSNPQLYVQDYNKFKKLLTEKYGKPVAEKEKWNTDNTSLNQNSNEKSEAENNYSQSTIWNTDRSVIKIMLVTIDKNPNLQIHYTTRSLNELENKEELKEALEKL